MGMSIMLMVYEHPVTTMVVRNNYMFLFKN